MPAAVGTLGAFAQSGTPANIGSPGTVVLETRSSVNISVSTATGTEAGATVITVTATASAAVSGAQTLTVGVTGTNITAGDYTLSSTTLTIADGATTGTVTFTVVDDTVLEGPETATVSISNPSAGIRLGGTTSQAITIIDNEAAGALAYSGTFNEGLAFDGAVTGKLLITLSGGETFTGANNDNFVTGGKATVTNVPAGLTAVLTRTSNTTAELSFTGTAATHTNAVDVSNLTVTFADGAFTGDSAAAVTNATKSDLAINFADLGTTGTAQTFTPNTGTSLGSSDASAAIALDANFMVVGDDEASVLRVYDRAGGNAVLEWSYSTALANGGELDLEAATRIGDTLYFAGSHSNSKSGGESDPREFLFAVTVAGSGAQTVFTYQGKHTGLETSLSTWDSTNVHGKGANYFGFTASSASGVVPEGVNGFSIEGMTATQDGSQLLLAFRAPQTSTSTREKAVIVPVAVAGLIGSSSPTIGTSIELDLGGRGIRSMEKSADGNGYLVLAGPAGGASPEVTNDFRFFRVSNDLATVTELDVDLDTLRDTTLGSFETIVDVRSTTSGTLVQLLQDNGDTDWPDRAGTTVSKDLPAADQKFQGNWVALGGTVTDSTGPTLASASPADDATNVGIGSNLVLKFNEGVKAGAGSFVIKKSSDNSVVETIAANDSKVSIAFNTVTINPSADLAYGTGFYVETTGSALTDHASNAWAGITRATTLNFTTAATPVIYSLLVTEVNSNAGPADFFELYNFGSTAIDLAGWKWDDDSANPVDAAAVALSGTIQPGGRLVVIQSASGTEAAFRTAWGLDGSVPVLATGGPGLGSGDAVVVFNQAGQVATAFNYGTSTITASDGTVIATAVRADAQAVATGLHAGVAMGGTAGANGVSAVWDGVSTSSPAYKAAVVGSLGAYAQSAASGNIGSPGLLSALPVITSNGGGVSAAISVAENSTAVTTVIATDADTGDTKTYSISGADSAKFNIVASTGVLTFVSAPDFEAPTDVGANNGYEVIVQVSDRHGGTDTQALTVTVTDVNEAPAPAPAPALPPAPTPAPPPPGSNLINTEDATVPSLPGSGGVTVAGDGNGDGIADTQQAAVISVQFRATSSSSTNQTAAPTYVTLVADSLGGKTDPDAGNARITSIVQKDAPAVLPEGMKAPLGLIGFTANIDTAGSKETFSLYVDAKLGVNGYWKQDAGGTWVNLASEAYGGKMVSEGGKLRLDFVIRDGGQFDADGVVNGSISDPGIVGSMAQSITEYRPKVHTVDHFWF